MDIVVLDRRFEHLITVDVGYACFGLIVQDGEVVRAAPIARWTIGKDEDFIMRYYQRKGAKVTKEPYTGV